MKRSRLLPAVAVAALALLGIKGASIAAAGSTGGAGPVAVGTVSTVRPNEFQVTITDSRSSDELAATINARIAELDAREADLAFRQNLLAAAEAEFAVRMAALEARSTPAAGPGGAGAAGQAPDMDGGIATAAAVLSAMSARQAGPVFDRLATENLPVLIEIANRMEQRKLAPILAEMSTAGAVALVTALARPPSQTGAAVAATGQGFDFSSLPQIGAAF